LIIPPFNQPDWFGLTGTVVGIPNKLTQIKLHTAGFEEDLQFQFVEGVPSHRQYQ